MLVGDDGVSAMRPERPKHWSHGVRLRFELCKRWRHQHHNHHHAAHVFPMHPYCTQEAPFVRPSRQAGKRARESRRLPLFLPPPSHCNKPLPRPRPPPHTMASRSSSSALGKNTKVVLTVGGLAALGCFCHVRSRSHTHRVRICRRSFHSHHPPTPPKP